LPTRVAHRRAAPVIWYLAHVLECEKTLQRRHLAAPAVGSLTKMIEFAETLRRSCRNRQTVTVEVSFFCRSIVRGTALQTRQPPPAAGS